MNAENKLDMADAPLNSKCQAMIEELTDTLWVCSYFHAPSTPRECGEDVRFYRNLADAALKMAELCEKLSRPL